MKINELVELVNNNKNKMLKDDQKKTMLMKELEVKDYISIKDKKNLVDNIVSDCILYDDGIYKFDDIEKYICFTMQTIEAYTNIELSNDIEEDYDALCGAKLLSLIIDLFIDEYESVRVLLQMKCDYILSSNSIEAQFGRFFNSVLDKVDIFTDVLSSKVEEFDISKLNINKEDISKLLSFIK